MRAKRFERERVRFSVIAVRQQREMIDHTEFEDAKAREIAGFHLSECRVFHNGPHRIVEMLFLIGMEPLDGGMETSGLDNAHGR